MSSGPDPVPATAGGSTVERPAPSVGVVLATAVVVAGFLDWTPTVARSGGVAVVPVLLGAAALGAFVARRHGLADRAVSVVPAVSAAAVLGYCGYVLWTVLAAGSSRPAVGAGLPFAAAGAVGSLVAAYLDWRSVPPERMGAAARDGAVATAVGLGGYATIVVWQYVLFVPLVLVGVEATRTVSTLVGTLALGLGTASTAVLYLRSTDLDRSYLDFEVPGLRDVGYAVVGVVGLFGALIGIQAFFARYGVESADHGIVQAAQGDPTVLLVLIPASWLVVGPGEELLFRNVVQKSLYERFPRPAAVVLASAVFAAVHLPAYSTGTLPQTLLSLSVVFALSLVLGGIYARTDNLTVPAFVHGTFNAVQFALLYASLTGMDLPLL